jgi:hypothetical protein
MILNHYYHESTKIRRDEINFFVRLVFRVFVIVFYVNFR